MAIGARNVRRKPFRRIVALGTILVKHLLPPLRIGSVAARDASSALAGWFGQSAEAL
jgi:hypothetical protein